MILVGRISPVKDPENREETGRQLQSVVERINREGRSLAIPFRVTRIGEEVVAAYRDAACIFDHIWLILYELYPLRMRFSIGIGEGGALEKDELDSQAFGRALEGSGELESGDGLFSITGLPGREEQLINHTLSLISGWVMKWNKKRFAVLYALSREREIGEVARLLGISERSVYKNINAGSLETILNTVREISAYLDT